MLKEWAESRDHNQAEILGPPEGRQKPHAATSRKAAVGKANGEDQNSGRCQNARGGVAPSVQILCATSFRQRFSFVSY